MGKPKDKLFVKQISTWKSKFQIHGNFEIEDFKNMQRMGKRTLKRSPFEHFWFMYYSM